MGNRSGSKEGEREIATGEGIREIGRREELLLIIAQPDFLFPTSFQHSHGEKGLGGMRGESVLCMKRHVFPFYTLCMREKRVYVHRRYP